jgi:ribosomal protein S18 acetylase RimI-like enzyme
MVAIREYDPARDVRALRECLVELQEFEREIDPRLPQGEDVADRYLELLFGRCREFEGVVLVAEANAAVVGFVAVWTRYRSSEPNDDPNEHGFVPDLFVSSSQRGRGVGQALMRVAEERARAAGAKALFLSVKAGNAGARAFYRAEGFVESEIYLEKPLG